MDLSKLNREQRIAAETLEGPVLILAGAGSGKTRALTYRVANLIDHGIPAWRILALTFTNKAAKEMKTRVADLIGAEAADEAWISTFHSTCSRILRRDIEKLGYSRSFVIYDDDDQARVLKEILKRQNIDEAFLPVRELRGKIGDAKNRLLSPDEWFQHSARDRRSSMIHDVMCEYEKRMKTLNALDFDDLLLKTLELLADHPPVLQQYRERFRYVMVDEYQDTNKAQYELIRLITAESRNLCVVGDDDQSIYGWRGADIRNILDFEDDYPDAKVIKLEQNYRSTANILDAANQVIANNEGRKDKKLWTEHADGEKIEVYQASDEHDESNFDYKYGVGFSTKYYRERRASFERNGDIVSWLCQYQGTPLEREGSVFSPEDLMYYNGTLPDREPDRVFMAVDPAWGGGDYCSAPVCYQFGSEIYMVDVVYDNSDKSKTIPKIARKVREHNVTAMYVEASKTTYAFAEELDKLLKSEGKRINMQTSMKNAMGKNKNDRILAASPDIREHFVFLESGKRSKEYEQFMQNVYSFKMVGKNKHDDAPDSLQMAITFAFPKIDTKVTIARRYF